jgi:hypothetical protein
MPWLSLFGVTFWQRRAEFFRSALILRQTVVLALTIAFGTIIVQTISVPGTTWRYLGDYAPFIAFAFLSVQFLIDKKRFKITLTPLLSAMLILGSMLIFGINSIVFPLTVLIYVAANASKIVLNLNLTALLIMCSIWTVAIIGLTSLTVGGFDPLNLVPHGYYWWE